MNLLRQFFQLLKTALAQLKPCSHEQHLYFLEKVKQIYNIYGGFHSLLGSPYLHASIIASLITVPFLNQEYYWYDSAISCLPSIIGMSFAAYAIILSFGNERFSKIIRGRNKKGESSPYLKVSSCFSHYIIVQIIVLILSLFSKSIGLKSTIFTFIGNSLLFYSILLPFAASIETFMLSYFFDAMKDETEKNDKSK